MTAEEIKQIKDEIVAEAVTEFWRQSYPVLVQMVAEMLPHQIAISEYMEKHSELKEKVADFFTEVLKQKKKTPNMPLPEMLETARKQLEG